MGPAPKKVKTITLGCRFNFYESEVSRAIINGLEPESDIVLINTCSLTHEAERQSKQAVRRAIRENRGAKVIVTGCAAKTSKEYFENLDGVFKVIHNDKKDDVSEYHCVSASNKSLDLDDIFDSKNASGDPEEDYLFKNKARVFLQIQNGCNHFCTYCIVPLTRGHSRSLPLHAVLRRIEYFYEHGFKEIVLSGIDIASYGTDLDKDYGLADLIENIFTKYPGLQRLRISSIDPKEMHGPLLDLLMNEQRIMPHFHLSIQSGDDEVLRLMRRRHTRNDVLRLCETISKARNDVVLGADLLVGLPFETEKMFENTLSLIDEAGLSLIHSFAYSPRAGTVAAQMIQHPRKIITERGRILREKANEARLKMLQSLVGQRVSGIIEKCEGDISFGKTDSFVPFKIAYSADPGFIIHDARVASFDDKMAILGSA